MHTQELIDLRPLCILSYDNTVQRCRKRFLKSNAFRVFKHCEPNLQSKEGHRGRWYNFMELYCT